MEEFDISQIVTQSVFNIDDVIYATIDLEEYSQFELSESIVSPRFSNDGTKVIVKYNVSESNAYESLTTKVEYHWDEIQNVLTSSEWTYDLSVHEFEADWINPEFQE